MSGVSGTFDRQTVQFLANLADMYQAMKGQQQKTVGTPTTNLPYGTNGIFGACGSNQQVVNAHVVPQGLDPLLPVRPSVYVQELYPYFTGVREDGDDEPSTGCANCPGGVIKSCYQTATIGRICRETQTLEINDLFKRTNRGQFDDLVFMGQLLGDSNFNAVQDSTTILQTATEAQMGVVAVMHQRKLSQMLWQGNPANNVGTGYMEFPGIDMLVNTGKVDAKTGTACPALDSDVKDFNYNDIDGIAVDIVHYISWIEHFCRHNADRMGLMPVEWVVVMRPELWQELSAVWPCRYLTHRCANDAGTNVTVINDDANVRMRDAMREGMFIWINGRRYQVVTDDGIYENDSTNNANLDAGEFASDIYFLPIRFMGNNPALYWEHMDYRAAAPDTAFLNGKQDFWWSDDGRFFWVIEQQSYCYLIRAKIEPRIVLRTPHIAGRLQNVKYAPLQHLRSPFPESDYHADGGQYSRSAWASWYSEWNARQ